MKEEIKLELHHNGHHYKYIDPNSITLDRVNALTIESEGMNYGMTQADQLAFGAAIDSMARTVISLMRRNSLDQAQNVQINLINLLNQHTHLMKLQHKSMPILNVAKFFITIDDEDPKETSGIHNELKMSEARAHTEVRDFFLSGTLPLYGIMIGLQNYTEIWDYLNQESTKMVERLFYDRLQKAKESASMS